MKTIRRVFYTAVLTSAFSMGVWAQSSNVRGAERIANSDKPNFEEARQLIGQALANDETKGDAKTWYTAGYVEQKLFTVENQKQFEQQTPDRALMNGALLKMYEYYMETYKIDHEPNSKGKIKPKFEKKLASAFEDNLLYYINALSYYMETKDFDHAVQAAEAHKQIRRLPMFEGKPIAKTDSNAMMLDFFAIIAAYQANKKDVAIKYAEEAKGSGFRQNETYQILTQTLLETGDTTRYIAMMKEGLGLFPQEAYYSVNLINTYISKNQYDEAKAFLAQAIELDPQNPQLYDVMGKLYEEDDIAKAQEWFLKALAINPQFAESNFNMGRTFYNMAVKATDQNQTAKAKELFSKALPYLVKAYELSPDTAAYLLANVHYRLGNNKEYERINKLHSLN